MSSGAPHPNAQMIARFYDALGRRDAATMIGCYAPDATFSDPVFPALDAAGVAAMWQMLCARGKDLAVVASDIDADEKTGRAHWVATYTFSGTGRRVENRIDARFTFRDGRIVRHEDRFDLPALVAAGAGVEGGAPRLAASRANARHARRRRRRSPTGARRRGVRPPRRASGEAGEPLPSGARFRARPTDAARGSPRQPRHAGCADILGGAPLPR
jgi:ketosteroid isomerase-like protein